MQTIETKYSLDLEDFFRQMELVSGRLGTVEDTLTGMRRQNPFVEANKAAGQFNTTLGQQITVYQKIDATAQSFRKEQERLKQVYTELKTRQNEFIAAGKYSELTGQLDQVKKRLLEMKIALGDVVEKEEELNRAGKSGDKSGGFLGDISGKVGQLSAMIGVSFGVAEGLRLMVTESAKFGKGLSQLSALTGVTGKDLEFLADAAVDLEIKTGIAATEIVEGFKLVGGIKPELLESKEALASVTNEVVALAQASGESLTDSATAAVGALNQFGEGADQAGRFVNVLAAGAKVGASEVKDTAEALKVSGTAMKAAGLSFEQGNAAIQSLAGVMIKGSEAGTALRNVLIKLETDTDKNLRPSIVGLDTALENAAKKYNTTTELTKVFGAENIVAARRILDTRQEITKLTKELTGTNTAYEQQKINLDNLSTDLDKAGTSITGFFRNLGQSQDGLLRRMVQGFTLFVQNLSNANSVARTFLGSLLDGKGGITSAFTDASRQSDINDMARKRTAELTGIKSAATQSVADDTQSLTDLYTKQGDTVPAAQKKAIQKVKEQRDIEYQQARADHNRLRKEYESAAGDEKKQYDAKFAQSRRAILAAQAAKKLADSEAARQAKADGERAATLKSLLDEPASEANKKAADKALKASQDNYKLLLSAQEDYVKEYQKIEEQFGKDRLDALKKDQNAYIAEKARLDKAAVDAEEAHLLKLLQLASSNQTKINKATGQREVVANTSVSLPVDVKAQFDARRKEIDAEADRQIRINRIRQEYELLELGKQSNAQELALYDKKWEGILAIEKEGSAKQLALIKKRDADRNALVFDQIIRDQKAIEAIAAYNIDLRQKQPDQTGQQFNRTNQLDLLATQQFSAESQISSLQAQDNPANTPEIKRLEAYVKALKDKRKEINLLQPSNRDIWDLLGVSKAFKDDTERQVFMQGLEMVNNAIREATQVAVQASEERIQALDAQIQAKEQQIGVEEERDKEGYANNLALRKAELADLKRQKAEEEAVKRRALAVQQALDLAAQVSNNAVMVSNTVTTITELFKQYAKIPFVGIVLGLGAIATVISTIISIKARARAITQLRQGGKAIGPKHEQGGIRGTGAFNDIEIEGGEHVTNAKSSEKFDKTLEAINQNDPRKAFLALLKEGGLGLPQLVIQHIGQPGFGSPKSFDSSRMEKQLADLTSEIRVIKQHTRPGKQSTSLGDGWVLEQEGNRETIRKIKKPI